MSDAQTPGVNISHANVTGKIPNAKGPQARGLQTRHSPHERKTTAKRLKRKGLISEKAAKNHGL